MPYRFHGSSADVGVLAEYVHPSQNSSLRIRDPLGLFEPTKLILERMRLFGQNKSTLRDGSRPPTCHCRLTRTALHIKKELGNLDNYLQEIL